MSVILGLNLHHADAAACLLVDGRLVGAVAEERLSDRLKHSPAFPENAIRWLLTDNGLRLADVTHVALPRDASANRGAKLGYVYPIRSKAAGRQMMDYHAVMRSTGFLIEIYIDRKI